MADETKADKMIEQGAEDTSLAKSDNGFIGGYSTEPEFDSSDTFIPRLRLGQGLSTEVQDGMARPGEWLLLGQDPVADVLFVPLAMATKHEMRDPDTREIIRHNQLGEIGEGPANGDCGGNCPFSDWSKDEESGKSIPPKCQFFYSYIGYSITHGVAVSIDFRKTAINTGKTLNTFVQQRKMGTFAVLFEAKEKTNKRGGKFFVPNVSLAPDSEEVQAGVEAAKESIAG